MIREEFEKSALRERMKLELRPGLLGTDLARYILETRPTVVHFSGHGNSRGICVESPDGSARLVTGAALASLFSMPAINRTVRLVTLSSCFSARQATAIAKSGPTVLGMRGSIDDESALAFSRGVYMAIGQGLNAAEAFAFGRNAIEIDDLPGEDVPVLINGRVGATSLYPLGRNRM
jgi:hypothetical protein